MRQPWPSSLPPHMLLKNLEDLLRAGGHLVDEVAAIEIETLGPQKTSARMPFHHGDPGLEPIGKHRAAAGFHQRHILELVPGQYGAFARAAEDHAIVAELEPGPDRAAHRQKADDRRRDRRPPDAASGGEEDDAAQLGDAGEGQEKYPRKSRVD